jgi:hypothetical protein
VDEQSSGIRRALFLVLGLLVIAVAGVALWLVVKSLFSNAAVAGPVIAASVALGVFAAGEFFTRRRVAQQYRWDKIAPTYHEFVGLVREVAGQENNEEAPPELLEFMGRFSDLLLLWGSPDVIKGWVGMLRNVERGYEDEREAVLDWARILLAIRKDLGHGDRSLDTRDLLKVVITDIDKYLPPGTKL